MRSDFEVSFNKPKAINNKHSKQINVTIKELENMKTQLIKQRLMRYKLTLLTSVICLLNNKLENTLIVINAVIKKLIFIIVKILSLNPLVIKSMHSKALKSKWFMKDGEKILLIPHVVMFKIMHISIDIII